MSYLHQLWDWLTFLFRVAFQTVVLTFVLYYFYAFLRKGSRGVQILTGIATIVGIYAVVQFFHLEVLAKILPDPSASPGILLILLCILFQPELRKFFAGIFDKRTFAAPETGLEATIEILVHTASILSSQRIGALIAIERGESLAPYELQGRSLKAPLVQDLLLTIFYPKTPLHDGAVILRNGVISAAGCIFPVALDDGKRNYGTRHRAALGITAETDAFVIVVSEETGKISVADHGMLDRGFQDSGLDSATLRQRLNDALRTSSILRPDASAATGRVLP